MMINNQTAYLLRAPNPPMPRSVELNGKTPTLHTADSLIKKALDSYSVGERKILINAAQRALAEAVEALGA